MDRLEILDFLDNVRLPFISEGIGILYYGFHNNVHCRGQCSQIVKSMGQGKGSRLKARNVYVLNDTISYLTHLDFDGCIHLEPTSMLPEGCHCIPKLTPYHQSREFGLPYLLTIDLK